MAVNALATHLDFETFSRIELKKAGSYRYSVDPSTEVLYACWATGYEDVQTWCPQFTEEEAKEHNLPDDWYYGPEVPEPLARAVASGRPIVAHNAPFERNIWENVVVRRHGGPRSKRRQFVCTAARAAAAGLPRSLEGAGMALNTNSKKDTEGARLLKLFAFPKKPSKKDPRVRIFPKEDSFNFKKLGDYCAQDVRTERDIDEIVPQLNESEQALFTFDMEINERGLKLDIPLIKKTVAIVSKLEEKIVAHVKSLTKNEEFPEGLRPTQRDKFMKFFKSIGVELENMQADYIKKFVKVNAGALKRNPLARELLALRIEAGKSSTKKLASMLHYAHPEDWRARGTFLFYGAHTGRWCLQANTPVIVKIAPDYIGQAPRIGWRRIQHVQLSDQLWDGVEWVTHCGVVFSGKKQTVKFDGVTATAEHEVWVSPEDKTTLGAAKENFLPIWRSTPPEMAQMNVPDYVTELKAGYYRTYDILLAGPRNRFALANGRIVSNSGKGVQPHNFMRGLLKLHQQQRVLRLLECGDHEVLETFFEWPISTISQIMRSFIMADKGRVFKVVDYSSIEARVLAWLAEDEELLEAFRKGYDPYKIMASKLFNVQYEKVTDDQRRIGKNLILGCGYGLGAAKFVSYSEKAGTEITEQFAKTAVRTYRAERRKVVQFWYDVERCAVTAVREKRTIKNFIRLRNLKFYCEDQWFCIELPSGRKLRYYRPQVKVVDKFGEPALQLSYKVEFRGRLISESTYGGKLVENIVQAIARDFMVNGMFNAEKAGYPVVGTVHDELITEPKIGFGSVQELEHVVCVLPPWGKGCPIAAKGFESPRYRKD